MLASQRIESVLGNWFWADPNAAQNQSSVEIELPTTMNQKRGATPSAIEWMILAWVSGKFVLSQMAAIMYHVVCFFFSLSLSFSSVHAVLDWFFDFNLGLIWSEVKQLWDIGLHEYVNDMWNVIDFVTNSLYVATVALRVVSYFQVFSPIASTEKSLCLFVHSIIHFH